MIVQKKKNLVLSVRPGQYKTTSSKRGQLFDIVHPDSVENHGNKNTKQAITSTCFLKQVELTTVYYVDKFNLFEGGGNI